MKLNYTTKDRRLTVQLEADTQTGLWEELAKFQEVFEKTVCRGYVNGKWHESDNVVFVVRNVDDNDFYELRCVEPGSPLFGARLSFGQHKKGGTLFPKSRFWSKWDGEKEVELRPGQNGSSKSNQSKKEETSF